MIGEYHQLLVTAWWVFCPLLIICVVSYAMGWCMGLLEQRDYERRQHVRRATRDRIVARRLAYFGASHPKIPNF